MVETEVSSLISPWLTPTCLFILLNIVLAIILFLNSYHPSKNNNNNSNNYNNDYYRNQDDGVSLVPPPPQLIRAPSLFSRISSFNFSQYYSQSPHVPPQDEPHSDTVTVTRAPSLLYRVASFKFNWASREADGEGRTGNDEHLHQHQPQPQQQQQQQQAEVMKVKKVNKKKKLKKEVVEVVYKPKETTTFRGEDEFVDSKAEGKTTFKGEIDSKRKETTAFRGEEDSKVRATTSFKAEDELVDSKADDFINRFKQQLKMQRLESLLRYRTNTDAT